MTRVGILGGGPAGVGAAWRLAKEERANVLLLERNEFFGGNAGSFHQNGHDLDFGSHRLHPASAQEILDDISGLLSDDLLDRPRHGRIRLRGRWVHFPLKPLDLMLRLDSRFGMGVLKDMITAPFRSGSTGIDENFATVLGASLGPTICDNFYFPYARKLWGHEPKELSAIQAHKRVSAGSFRKLLKKVFGPLLGIKKKGAGRFFYPRRGFGQISEALAQDARRLGATLMTSTTITRLTKPMIDAEPWLIETDDGELSQVDRIFSTLPLTILVKLLPDDTTDAVREAADAIRYQAMVLVYLELDTDQFTEFDACYFPETDITMSRLSEPKNYSERTTPDGRTVLCAEIPCAHGDALWNATDEELGQRVQADLQASELPLQSPPITTFTRRLPQAYPIYEQGFEAHIEVIEKWASALPRFLSFGRQGLFAHDNTHHALAMANAAARCLDTDGTFDAKAWESHLIEFATHVVED